ncbi:MAG: type I-U CRISPR-associated protein Cas7 [Actinobacteria bacterium]|nr:type I-U CRISPR-associated protein Cas7 [Actinomycetota bacterium]
MTAMTLDLLLQSTMAGGPSCLTSTTELQPAGGWHASVAPAKFAAPRGEREGVYAYERRFLGGAAAQAVILDSKQSQLNRAEEALQQAIDDGHPVLARLAHVVITYQRDGVEERYTDLMLPHRIYDGHIRAGTVDGEPVTAFERYRAVRNATPANARALLETSPVTLVFGGWDSSRRTRQGRWRSALVGEIVGFCADPEAGPGRKVMRGGARVDPVAMQVLCKPKAIMAMADAQRDELSTGNYNDIKRTAEKGASDKVAKEKRPESKLGLGGIPPTLAQLAGVACDRIIRSHVLSFATLRQMRFGAGPEGDAACRALLAALALNGLARSDAELCLRANCDLREASAPVLTLDRRDGQSDSLERLTIAAADALLADALQHAESTAAVQWNGVALQVVGNQDVIAGAVDEEEVAPV